MFIIVSLLTPSRDLSVSLQKDGDEEASEEPEEPGLLRSLFARVPH